MNAPPDTWDLPFEIERYELYENASAWELNRRHFFRVVGGGVVVALLLSESAEAQPPGGRRRGGFNRPAEIGAWLHVGADGAVTVFTGKVELGQNIRTSLTQVVAEELHAPIDRIRLVMADTALTPFDMGTFGSQTTPRMASQLRRVAAAARETLLDLAAEQKKLDRASLTAANGKVVGPGGKPTIDYGQLTKGQKLLKTVTGEVPTTPAAKWTVAGTSVPKVDGRALVTGAHQFSPDVRRPGMLFGKVLRPPSYHAKLTSVETKDAEALPGVKAVHDGDFVGVIGPTEQAAMTALDAIKAQWQEVPQSSSETLFKDLKSSPAPARGGRFGGGRGGGTRGSIEAGLKAADQTVKATYTIAYIAHAPLETRAAVAEWAGDKLTVWTGTQRPFGVRGELTAALHLPAEQVRVIVPDTGSGYGGKHTGEAAVEAARLAKAAGHPVKVVWTRAEEFTWAYFRPAGVIEVTAGATKDGTLTVWDFHNWNSGGSAIRPPYAVANLRAQFHPASTPLRQGSYRALAATANHFARESHIDDLAHAVGMDPLAFRLKNLKDARVRAVLETAAKQFGWGKKKPAAGHGFGIAGGTEKGSYVAACAEIAVDGKGQVQVLRVASAFECGAILNPEHLKNQVEGAVVMGLGGALFEQIEFAGGKILNAGFSEYRVPRFRDAPRLETVLLNRPDLPSAGAGETPIVAIAPAVGNAIFQATGVRLRSLPMAPKGVKVS